MSIGPPDDVTANYLEVMRDRGWSWHDLADDFARQALQPSLDRGASARSLERWARTNGDAAVERRAAADDPTRPDPPAPEHAAPGPPKRGAVPPRLPRRA